MISALGYWSPTGDMVRISLPMLKEILSLNSPCSYPSSKIDDVCWIMTYRREMKMTTHEREYHDVLHVFSNSQLNCHRL
jgi:hypothetical protein